MSEHTRYRITGGVFLVSLAVIFLPMLFDGSGLESATLEEVRMPARAAQKLDQVEIKPLQVAVEELGRAKLQVDEVSRIEESQRMGEVVLKEPPLTDGGSDPTVGWGVQLGSFGAEKNAQQLRKKLERDGLHAVLSRANKDGQTITRVAVGPVLSESEALDLRSKISETYQIEAIVVQFGH